jgi:polysaccharide export outer membrane protein
MTLLMLLMLLGPPQAAQRPAAPPEYIVGVQDRLAVTVFNEPALTRTVTVDASGTFDFPLVGRIKANGLTVRAIEEDLTSRLGKDFYVNPQVTIEVETYRSQFVYVTGQVRNPGAVPLTGNMTAMDALARVGSPTPDAGPYVVINRRNPHGTDGQSTHAAEKVSMEDLLNGLAQNIILHDGDTIFVPKAEPFFVTGQVRNPGLYLLDRQITFAKAVSMAGGVTERGSRTRIRVTRVVDGKQIVLKQVKLDDLVQPGDSIEVLTRLF